MATSTPTLQEFSVIRTKTEEKQRDLSLPDPASAFYFVAMDMILRLQEDEIRDSITDSNFLKVSNQPSGHDRGIDALYIDESSTPPTIHLFNFKYATNFQKAKNNFPSGEIDKILSFISSLNQQEETLIDSVNAVLGSKVQDIWRIFESQNPNFEFHFCSNHFQDIEPSEKGRFERSVGRGWNINYHLSQNLIEYIFSSGKQTVNSKIRGIDKGYFEKTDGNIRALILYVDARDLVRIVLDDENIRNKVDMDDSEYEAMKELSILEDSFDDNVRVYQKKSSINKNIKSTALSEENDKFFYYNNGVTITCKSFSHANRRSPVVELEDLQIVNGSQTIHSLYEAFLEDSEKFAEIEILCRVCEVKDPILSTRIAEYTNSQNPVKSRDIRSVDYIQLSLEQEFLSLNKFYERKKNQYSEKPRQSRIDAEKAGQVLMALFNRSPYEAKNRKGLIFGDKYEEVFNEEVNADKVLLAHSLFESIEAQKNAQKDEIVNDPYLFDEKSYIIHASYYILYIMGELARRKSISLTFSNYDEIWDLYPDALSVIERTIQRERDSIGQKYSHSIFFRSNKSKKYFEDLEEDELLQLLGE
ncbi:MAG: AIPR family protein [Cyanobacteria bacterium J06636_16]